MVQAALQPISSIMVRSGLGVGELIEAAKLAYIQAAIDEVIPAGGRVNISRLAVATGLTRKEIAGLLKRANQRSILFPSSKRKIEQRALRVLRGWTIDPLFQRTDGRPADLSLRGDKGTFPALVKKYGADVTPVSVLRELERMKAVVTKPGGKIRLCKRTTSSKSHTAEQMMEFARALKDFANTARQIYESRNPPIFFGFKDSVVSSLYQAALFQRTFSARATALLEGIDQWASRQTDGENAKQNRSKQGVRIGLGVYLLQEDKGASVNTRHLNRKSSRKLKP